MLSFIYDIMQNEMKSFLTSCSVSDFTLFCRTFRSDDRTIPLWRLGGATPLPFLIVFTVNLFLNITWLFVWSIRVLIASAVVLLLTSITNDIAWGIACNR